MTNILLLLQKTLNTNKTWQIILLSISIFAVICIVRNSYSFEINRLFADQNLTLRTRINFALELASRKFDGQKIWLIYSIDSFITTREWEISQENSVSHNPILCQIIFAEKDLINKQLTCTNNLDQLTACFVKNLKQNTSVNYIQTQPTTTKSDTSFRLGIILDYSLESGRPCLYQIYVQPLARPFLKETRPIFWLGEATCSISIDCLIKQFYQTNYEKLKQQIISTIGVHNCTKKVIEFQKRIILGDYPISLKNEAVCRLGQHNSLKNIQLLTHLAINNKDTRIRKKAIFALSQIKDERAQSILFALAKKDKNHEIRQEAIFWLSQIGNEGSIKILNDILNREPDPLIREYTIFAISQLPEKKAAPILSQIARTHPDIKIRKKAIFWLSPTREQKMMEFFLDLVEERDRQSSN